MKSALLLILGIVTVTACSASSSRTISTKSRSGRLTIVTTVAPITSITANIAGDGADVVGVVPEGVNSHTFDPPPSAAKMLAQADVVFINGLKLEDPTRELAAANLRRDAEIIDLGARTIAPSQYIYDFSFPKDGGKPNPHLWTNPPYAKAYGEVIAATLERRDPEHAQTYRRNFVTFAANVDRLDQAMKTATATLAPDRRQLLTYHDAYAYFAKHYGWRVIGAIQVSSFDDPTPKEVARLIGQVRSVDVPAIFGSEVFPSPVLRQIGNEAHVKYVDVLRDDDLPGRPGEAGHSWFGLMRFDFITMIENLGGDAAALRTLNVPTDLADHGRYPQ